MDEIIRRLANLPATVQDMVDGIVENVCVL